MRRVALELPVEIARVGKRGDLEALLGQVARQEVAQAHVVVDDEDLRCGEVWRPWLRVAAPRGRARGDL